MLTKMICAATIATAMASLCACAEHIEKPKCSDLKRDNQEMLKKQEVKYPELMRQLREKCPNQGSGGFVPSTATKGIIR